MAWFLYEHKGGMSVVHLLCCWVKPLLQPQVTPWTVLVEKAFGSVPRSSCVSFETLSDWGPVSKIVRASPPVLLANGHMHYRSTCLMHLMNTVSDF